jgi:hypothetical protein
VKDRYERIKEKDPFRFYPVTKIVGSENLLWSASTELQWGLTHRV